MSTLAERSRKRKRQQRATETTRRLSVKRRVNRAFTNNAKLSDKALLTKLIKNTIDINEPARLGELSAATMSLILARDPHFFNTYKNKQFLTKLAQRQPLEFWALMPPELRDGAMIVQEQQEVTKDQQRTQLLVIAKCYLDHALLVKVTRSEFRRRKFWVAHTRGDMLGWSSILDVHKSKGIQVSSLTQVNPRFEGQLLLFTWPAQFKVSQAGEVSCIVNKETFIGRSKVTLTLSLEPLLVLFAEELSFLPTGLRSATLQYWLS